VDPSDEHDPSAGAAPWCIVIAGVSGSGKSTIAAHVAARTAARLADGDDLHTAAAVARMRAGTPLEDSDRLPWLRRIGGWIDDRHDEGAPAVISCSALRRSYRDELVAGRPWVRFCLLDVPLDVLHERLLTRTGHFMPASLLDSQLALLEPLGRDEPGCTIEAMGPPDHVAATVLRRLGHH